MKNLSIFFFIIVLITMTSLAQIPRTISFQGVLTDSLGNPAADALWLINFRLYDAEVSGNQLWIETKEVKTNRGLFSTTLGSVTPFGASVRFDKPYWLSIQVVWHPEMGPRIPLTAVGYSFNSLKADTAEFAKSTSLQISVDSARIAGTVPNNSITSQKILDGTIQRADVQSTFKAPYADTSDFAKASVAAWNITGNSGTSAGRDFVGTTDAQALDIRTNNVLRTRITTKGQIETYNTGLSVFVGEGAGRNDDLTTNQNVFVGYQAGYSNTTGDENTANGVYALYSNVAGSNATAIGARAMFYANNTATPFTNSNVAVGYEALRGSTTAANNTGIYNTAIGYQTLYSNTTGIYNTANGFKSLYSNTAGSANTANGMYSLSSIITESNNTAIGYSAGDNYTFSLGTFVGRSAYPNANGYTNCMGLGYDARPTGSNRVHIGNTSITWIGGQVTWGTYSDGRYKKNLREDVRGLDFIMKLRPVTYNIAVSELSAFLKEDQKKDKEGNTTFETNEIDRKSRAEKEAIRYTGFVAQEVEQASKELGFDFSGIDKPKDENNIYSLRYAEFVVPLVKAVQEQQATIQNQQKIIDELTRRIENLERK